MYKISIVFLTVSLIAGHMLCSCSSGKPPVAPAVEMRDSCSVMTTYGVSKLISDSGVIRYKIVAEEWNVHDRTNPPKQTFPKGLVMEKFNEKFHVEMYITADTAYWYNQNLWELRGRVCVWNDQGTIFNSELLYWDMNRHEMYSNMFMTIRKPDEYLQGYNFRSNEQMTRYTVTNANAETPFSDSGSSTSPTDSVTRTAPTKPNQP